MPDTPIDAVPEIASLRMTGDMYTFDAAAAKMREEFARLLKANRGEDVTFELWLGSKVERR